jgi:putative nucleotidyltransferase with HDIG domain
VTKAEVLIVDDEDAIREVVSTLLQSQGYRCSTVENGRQAVQHLEQKPTDLVLSDMLMPQMDGLQLLSWLHSHDPEIPMIMVTAMHDVSTALECIRQGAYDYILKPFEKDQLFLSVRRALEHRRLLLENRHYQRNLEQLVEQRAAQLKQALAELEQSYDATLEALGGALDLKDSETVGHCKRVTAYTMAIAQAMNLPVDTLPQIARAAFLHDIGKMAIPDRILQKPGALTAEERDIMRTHCEIGYKMLLRIPFLQKAAEIVYSHQEFFDGAGYPRGLRGEQIPLGARIFAIADAVDAMLSDRPYRKGLSVDHARKEVKRCSGTQFDPKIVEVFLSLPEPTWLKLRENAQQHFRLATSAVLV